MVYRELQFLGGVYCNRPKENIAKGVRQIQKNVRLYERIKQFPEESNDKIIRLILSLTI